MPLPEGRINREDCGRNGIRRKNGGMVEVGAPIVRMGGVRQIVGASASVIFPCSTKSRRWRAIMEEVDKGCIEFCVTAGTATRSAGILIHSRLKALAVNLSRPFGRLVVCWLIGA